MISRLVRKGGWPKWIGLVLTVSLAGSWWGTAWYALSYMQHFGDKYFLHITLERGQVRTFLHIFNEAGQAEVASGERMSPTNLRIGKEQRPGRLSRPLWTWTSGLPVHLGDVPAGTWSGFDLVLWVPALIFAVPTAYLWYRRFKRRIPPGHCKSCGYNLHGLTEPRCPECGTPFEMSSQSEAVSSKAETTQQDATQEEKKKKRGHHWKKKRGHH